MKKVFIIAGEPSGDALGASLLRDLRTKFGTDLSVKGIGGPGMAQQGLVSQFSMQDLTLMGVAEVLPKIPHILKRLRETVQAIVEFEPHVIITIDIPDFASRLAKRLQSQRRHGLKLVHYVAPTVWAWRPERAKKIAKLYDLLLCLFPFEPSYFTHEGLAAKFVGHPVVYRAARGDGARLRASLKLSADNMLLCLLPGSRRSEIERLLPVFLQTIAALRTRCVCKVILPTLPHLVPSVQNIIRDMPNITIVTGDQQKWDAMEAADIALAASGTVTLELAMADCPHIIAYQVSWLTHQIVRHIITTPYANLVNVALNQLVIPEFIQHDVVPEQMADCLHNILTKPELQHQQRQAFALLKKQLTAPQSAADVIEKLIQ